MTTAPDKVDGSYIHAQEFLRRDEYDSWLSKERELLKVVAPILTREQWLASSEPFAMLALLRDVAPEEELRAFCCLCCRRMWLTHNATEAVMLDALRIAEAFAAGQASREEMRAAPHCSSHALEVVHIKPGFTRKETEHAARAGEEKAQADMIRERWHNPAQS